MRVSGQYFKITEEVYGEEGFIKEIGFDDVALIKLRYDVQEWAALAQAERNNLVL